MKYTFFINTLKAIKMVSKKSIMILALIALALTVKAQDKPEKEVINIEMDKYRVLIIQKDSSEVDSADVDEDDSHNHWRGFFVGINGYSTPNNSLDMPNEFDFLDLDYSKSFHLALNFMEKDINIYKEYVQIVTGLGIDWNRYSFKNNIRLVPNSDTIAAITDSIADFEKNKLKTMFISLPLLLAFNTNEDPEKAFHLAVGVVLGYKLASKTKQKYTVEDETYKPKIKSNYNLFPFRYGLTLRMGYGNFILYADHSLSPLFEDGEGPKLHPFSMGIRITGL